MQSAAPFRVICCLPDNGFDVSESAVPWEVLRKHNVIVDFATQEGVSPECDPLLLKGHWLFPFIQAPADVQEIYSRLRQEPAFQKPKRWRDDSFDLTAYDGLLLPGGHAKGVRQLVECTVLRKKIEAFFVLVEQQQRVCAAICHGVLALSRARHPADVNRSLLYAHRSTCLPRYMENMACNLTWLVLGDYYRTYPNTTVEDELRAELKDADTQFQRGPLNLFGNKSAESAFVVQDGNYLSARWPGDAQLLGELMLSKLTQLREKPAVATL